MPRLGHKMVLGHFGMMGMKMYFQTRPLSKKKEFTGTCRIGYPEYFCCSVLLYGGKSLTFHLLPWCLWIFIRSLRHRTLKVGWDIYDPEKKMDLFIRSVTLHSLAASGGVYTNLSLIKVAQKILEEWTLARSDTLWDFHINIFPAFVIPNSRDVRYYQESVHSITFIGW